MDKSRQPLSRCSHLLCLPNVVGIGRGYKEVRGRNTGKPVVTVMVTKKIPKRELPRWAMVPLSLGDAETDVIEVGEIRALGRTDRERPARPGMSIGHYKITAGTFGAVVYDVKTGEPLILSNNHVLANSTNGRDGRARPGDPILQPGRYDGGTEKDVIAKLERFVPIYKEVDESRCKIASMAEDVLNYAIKKMKKDYQVKLYRVSRSPNLVDAAVARPLSVDDILPDILELGTPRETADVEIGQLVMKSGRTSGLTKGRVKVVDATVRIAMGDAGDAIFAEQIVTTQIAAPGDSGSLVVDENIRAVGLLSAGSDTVSVFGRIDNVLGQLAVRL
ncbi:MAG: hypothetical protein IMW97_07505 [Firmicutes bacterium]|nr:hypothetical protein [Candidatus Fermentithermobacillaceae bacterium]